MKKKDYLYMLILLVIPLILVNFIVPGDKLFGNSIDWLNQHVMIGDALRHAIREEGTLFPTYLSQLMGGCNIYHFSYYGYLRPDVLLGALLIQVDMIDIIIVYNIFLIILSAISCYLFLRHQNKNNEICLFVSILMILSSLFFHAHKQIMFVNYIPFLFFALLSIDYYLATKHLIPFVICGTLIMVHSYFYSIGCYLICLIYYIYKSYLINQHLTKLEFFKFIKGFVFIGMITAVLTIPTLYVIAGNSKSLSETHFLSLFDMSFNLKGLLYDNYGCGLTYLIWITLVLGVNYKKTKALSIITMIAMTLPLVSYIFNGFLYARSKILIVFIPIIAYISSEVIDQVINKELKWDSFSILLISIPLFFIQNPLFVCLDILICVFVFLTKKHIKYSYFFYLLVPLLVVYINNPASSFLDKKTYQSVTSKEQTTLVGRHKNDITRFADFDCNHQGVNNTYHLSLARASGYTSTNHTLYNQFLYDILHLPVSINNCVANQDNAHPFYLGMMSIDTFITKDKKAIGYKLIDKEKDYCLYQNQNVMPIAYASSNLFSEKAFKKLCFPKTLDTLYNNIVVRNGTNDYQSQFVNEKLEFDNSYHIQNKKQKTFTQKLQRTTQNKILVIEFDVKNNHPEDSVKITINGIKNKLSSINTPYYNNNTHLTYVLSDEQIIDQLKITLSKGDYQISHIKCSSLDNTVIQNRNHEVDQMNIKKGKDILNGDIDVSNDGYFATNLPFDKGYTIYIDHQKIEPEIVNTAFLGCPIKKGHHQISITFQPRGYQLAYALSWLGIICTLLNFIYERKKKHER